MTATLRCTNCGKLFPSERCPRCGSEQAIVMRAERGEFTLTGHPPTIIIFGPDKATGDTVARVDAPGARSEARLTRVGTVSVVVEGTGGVGRPGEPRVVKVLRARLKAEGVESEARPGDDSKGEDGWLDAAGASYVLQIVTVPQHSNFWRDAALKSATTSVEVAQVGEWIEESIQLKVGKIPESNRANIILALDANHAGVLAGEGVVTSYLDRYGSPTLRFKFVSVWLVGPTPDQCVRLGIGIL